ncbi:MAG: hypothetical protein AAGA87_08705 [Pseudomonadota bacterium]
MEQTPTRLVLSDAPSRLARVLVLLLILAFFIFTPAMVNTLGAFGWLMFVLWVTFAGFLLWTITWTQATFDAGKGRLELRLYRLPGWFRRAEVDLSGLEGLSPDELEVWARLVGDGARIEEVRETLRVRREMGSAAGDGVVDAIQGILDAAR